MSRPTGEPTSDRRARSGTSRSTGSRTRARGTSGCTCGSAHRAAREAEPVQRFDGRDPALQQVRWRASARPVASLRSGETIEVDVPDSSSGQLTRDATRSDLRNLDLSRVDAAVGPFEVDGARPGDSVVVRIEAIDPADWGWSGVFREFGLLRDRFEDDL